MRLTAFCARPGSIEADLIVLGAHRKQLLRDIFVGTTIERVIRTSPYPVLMVNAEVEQDYRNVLAAVDMSEPSARAIRVGKDLGLFEGKRLTLRPCLPCDGSRTDGPGRYF